ncbi:hypothetical protein [Caryophanon tenue]|uniref:Uncharacterized protein n=1 Tax=Caryophanon tenue TaxID=33978 RepID=A0A1C0Y575_9BACL|nr:hypothetical protein [Caryophanon tenue]OCS82285.1 hypothetical protein A6M13_07575 [Caryophanon tenue]
MRSELDGKLINSIYESVGYDVNLFIRSSADNISWTHYRKVVGYSGEESFSSSFYYQIGAILTDRYNQGVFLQKIELFIEEAVVHNNDGDMDIPIKLNLFDKVGNQEIKIYNNSTNEELVVNNLNESEILYK